MKFPRFFGRETKASETASTLVMTPGQPVWSGRDFAAFAKEGYQTNIVAAMSIQKIAESVSSVPIGLWRGETEIEDHNLLTLFERPNPMQSGREYTEAVVSYLMIAGNSYEEQIEVNGEPRELYALRPDRMSPIPGQSGFPVGYEYRGPNGGRVRYDIDADAGVFPIWHTRFFNPLDDWVGQSPMEAGAYSIDQHNEAMGWMQGLLQNSARPSGALVVQKDSSGAFRDLSPDAFSRLKQQIADQYSGSRNAGRPMLLEGGLDWKAMGLSPSDVGIIEAKNSAARDVALAFGVPPMLLGIPGDNTYANYKEARLAFWEDTVIPLVGRIAGERTQWLADDGMEFRPDFSDVPAIIDKKASQWEAAEASTDLTIDERRAIKGYGPLPNGAGDVLPQQISQPAQHDVTDTNIKAMAKIAGYANAQIDRK